jgi:hypothetical protein
MAIIVIGGHARNVGKTSLAAAIIASWPERRWTAVKISSHWHNEGKDAAGADPERDCRIDEDLRRGGTDTGRYLEAGAARSFWIRVKPGKLEECLPQLQTVLGGGDAVIESNAMARFVPYGLFLMVCRPDIGEFKESARKVLPLADAVVAVNCTDAARIRAILPAGAAAELPVFPLEDPRKLTPELVGFIKSRIE